MKRKLTKYEKVLIVILALSIVAVIVSHQRIATKIEKVWGLYTVSSTEKQKPDSINKK